MADVQTGFGSFVSFYLADQGWSEENVGFVLTAGGLSGVVGQIPGGALVDAMRRKRLLIAVGTLMIAASAVLLALSRDFPAVFAAEVLHGATGAIIGPAIAAVSLGLVGRRAMSGRIGRNRRFLIELLRKPSMHSLMTAVLDARRSSRSCGSYTA